MFKPVSETAVNELDAKTRSRLAESVQLLLDQSLSEWDLVADDCARVPWDIRQRRQMPDVYARYFMIVFALKAGRVAEACGLLRDLAARSRRAPSFEVRPLTRDAMGDDAMLYARLLQGGAADRLFAAPDGASWSDLDTRVPRALTLLDKASSALATEVRGLIVEVVGAVPGGPRSFGSASSLTLWGAAVINLHKHRTMLDLIDGLVHEAAHTLLFGYAIEQPLVTNAADEGFSSPLRADPRPMDGVFHATFVCARLHLLYSHLMEADLGALCDERLVAERRTMLKGKFDDGAGTIARHGRLTDLGEEILQASHDYMRHAA